MALRFIDSFDHYSTAQGPRKWTSFSGAITAGTGRRGTNGISFGTNVQYYKTIDNQPTWTVGFNLFLQAAPSSNIVTLLRIMDTAANEQMSLRIPVGQTVLQVTRNGTLLATSPALGALSNTYIEFKTTINNTTGTYELRFNGVAVVGPTAGANTRATANNFADTIMLGPTNNNVSLNGSVIDDLYINDGTGGAPNDSFLGDCRVDANFPVGPGNSTLLLPTGAAANWQCVDENPTTDDSDFVSSSTPGDKDTYDFGSITHTPLAIFGAQVNMVARKDDAGARSICSVVRSGGADTDGATQALTTSYAHYQQVLALDPATGLPWTKTGFNAAEFGVKVAA